MPHAAYTPAILAAFWSSLLKVLAPESRRGTDKGSLSRRGKPRS
jgi:hypothetical protein